ncbi:MAG: serine hydroxymethyltransferase [Methylacidiphilales bacterium]|nr:serine hydroxymethyltransferase [Candidatus Methylacidiphilales bacterium]
MIDKYSIEKEDTEIFNLINKEAKRQEEYLELIASENYTSLAVMSAQGSCLTNKYAEGLPQKRYYGGCSVVDEIEIIAQERAKKLFNADFVNVQPHSGSQANAAAYLSVLSSGDTILGMRLSDGGHLTHGAKVNFSGKLFNCISYGIDPESELIDYDEIKNLALKYNPKVIVAGYSAYSRILDFKRFKDIADLVGALLMVDMAHFAGLVAAGVHPSPIPYADIVTTTTHKTLRGPRGGLILCKKNPELEKKLNSLVFPGIQGGPLMHVIAAKAVAFKEALQPEFKEYQTQVILNAKSMSEQLKQRGFHIVSGGTDNHLFLLSLINSHLSGKEAEELLELAHITTNKNTVPNEKRSAFVTSGLRIGTPAITTRGFKEQESKELADYIATILEFPDNPTIQNEIKKKVQEYCLNFPVYQN